MAEFSVVIMLLYVATETPAGKMVSC